MTEADKDDKAPVDDDTLLAILKEERIRAIGFDNDGELTSERQKALEYFKGEMSDMPSLANRSSATTTDVADAIRTLLPDIVDIFTGGDDVATFIPTGPEDEKAARQETDYLKNVIFQQNNGFHTVYTMIQDALQSKVGVATYYWEDYQPDEELLEGKTQEEAQAIEQLSQQGGFQITAVDAGDEPNTFDITIQKPGNGKICIKPIPPEDFAVAQDTVLLSQATYCAMRSRPRAQQLVADGYDADIISQLPSYGLPQSDITLQARDTAGEYQSGQTSDAADNMHRQVEVIQHYIRLLNEKTGKLEVWKVLTGGGENILIDKEKVDRIQFAGITPYVVTHRFYGESVADLLMAHQRQSTAVMRAWLDQIYFALNQRAEIAEDGMTENTIADFLRNEPGVPVRTKRGGAIKAIEGGKINVDLLSSMEYLKTVAENKTGVVRATQGISPDTLHETARGALALMSASQRRMRLIARIFAETGFKDLFLGVHSLIRQHSTQAEQMRFSGDWVSIDPSSWGERADMAIEIGLGSGGKDQAIAVLMQQADMMTKIVEAQGGLQGPVVTAKNIANLLTKFFEVTGSKQPEQYVSDPDKQPPQPPQPDPKAIEAQAKAQQAQQALEIQHAKNQGDAQIAQAKAQSDAQLAQQVAAVNAQLERDKWDHEAQLKRETTQQELDMKWQIAQAELAQSAAFNEQKLRMDHEHRMASLQASKSGADVQVGGEPG